MAPRSDDESSGGDIPPKKRKSPDDQSMNDLQDATNGKEDEEDSELAEDEFIVEKILAHKFVKKALTLLVKWQGYSEQESTWEPQANLENCPDELEAYYKEVGGKPVAGNPASSSIPPAKRAKVSKGPDANQTPTPPPNAKRSARTNREESAKNQEPEKQYPKGSWEEDVLAIDTMTKENGIVYVWLVWKDNTKSAHTTSVVYAKCPQKCLQFYESHLQFNPAPKPVFGAKQVEAPKVKAKAMDSPNIAKSASDPDSDEGQVSSDAGVKNVAVKKVATAV